jgi:hypothetical protein
MQGARAATRIGIEAIRAAADAVAAPSGGSGALTTAGP